MQPVGEFRLPEIMAVSSARLVEVGTTNRTRAADYQRALGRKTGLILKVHPSNYRVIGFTNAPSLAELSELAPEEAAEFRGSGESALGEVVRRLAERLDLITFFTAGEKETRAWTLRRGETALDAAATIHSDIARGFIRCEVVRWDDLVAAGGHAEAARAGKQRLEAKPYVVEDGDVLNIRFNV